MKLAEALSLRADATRRVEQLRTRIVANARFQIGPEGTITDALARRDVLRARHSVVTAAADAAAGRNQGAGRQLRSELKMLTALPVADLRSQADDLARQVRELDVRIQQSNWQFDLLE